MEAPFRHRAVHEPLLAAEQLGDERLRQLYALWLARGPAPDPSFIDPVALRFILGSIIVFAVVGGGERTSLRFRYRLCGTQVVDRMGMDLTGRHVDEHPVPESRILIGRLLESVVRERAPYLVRADRRKYSRIWRTESAVLPLFDPAGEITTILAGQIVPPDVPAFLKPDAEPPPKSPRRL